MATNAASPSSPRSLREVLPFPAVVILGSRADRAPKLTRGGSLIAGEVAFAAPAYPAPWIRGTATAILIEVSNQASRSQ
jgi:hypothetical protein